MSNTFVFTNEQKDKFLKAVTGYNSINEDLGYPLEGVFERYKSLITEITSLKENIHALKLQKGISSSLKNTQLENLESQLSQAKSELEKLQGKLDEAQSQLTECTSSNNDNIQKITGLNTLLESTTKDVLETQKEIKSLNDKKSELDKQISALTEEGSSLKKQIVSLKSTKEVDTQQKKVELEKLRIELENVKGELEICNNSKNECDTNLNELKNKIKDLKTESLSLKSKLEENEKEKTKQEFLSLPIDKKMGILKKIYHESVTWIITAINQFQTIKDSNKDGIFVKKDGEKIETKLEEAIEKIEEYKNILKKHHGVTQNDDGTWNNWDETDINIGFNAVKFLHDSNNYKYLNVLFSSEDLKKLRDAYPSVSFGKRKRRGVKNQNIKSLKKIIKFLKK